MLLLRTKPVRPTESGEIVVRFARRLARLEDEARAELGMPGTGEPTRLSVAVNADSLATWFLPALTRVPPGSRSASSCAAPTRTTRRPCCARAR